MAWEVVYELDWRDAFTALGFTDLSAAGTSFAYDGVTWTTPNPQVATTAWALEAGGLHCRQPSNSRFTATNHNAPHVYATLYGLGANASSPFEADPARQYIFQCYVTSVSLTPVNNEGAFMGIYRQNLGSALGNANLAATSLGQYSGAGPINWARGGVSGAPGNAGRPDRSDAVLTVHWVSAQRVNFFCAPWNGVGDWPTNGQMRSIGSYRSTVDFNNDLMADPVLFRVACAHNSPSLSSGYDGTIERFRIQQQVRPQ